MELVTAFRSELERLDAADEYGESGGLWAWDDNGRIIAGDEVVQVEVTEDDLQALRQLPDGAGWEAAWLALSELVH